MPRIRIRLIAEEATEAHMTVARSSSPIARAGQTLDTRIFAMAAEAIVWTTIGERWTRIRCPIELQGNLPLHPVGLHG